MSETILPLENKIIYIWNCIDGCIKYQNIIKLIHATEF